MLATFALAFAPLLQAPEGPELLPATPDGWRFERLEFPLSFAPDIALEGFEELAFAPGMFEPESESYFSYALAIRAEGEHEVDAAWLEAFLVDYYRGLCEAVGKSRKPEPDLSDFAVRVTRGAHGWRAAVDMVDAFVTGEPLQLELELELQRTADATELFGLASPMPAGSPIWGELRALAEEWRAARPPAVYLNHLYLIPDVDTYRALTSSAFLKDGFGICEERTTTRPDLTYTGLYVYGEHTYFEFLKPDPDSGHAPGATGLAFGVEAAGATTVLAERLKARDIDTFAGSIERDLEGTSMPWFEILGISRATQSSRLDLFSLEYDPSFLRSWHADLAPMTVGIQRARVLERYAASLEQTDRRVNLPFQDVVEVHLALDAQEREHVVNACRALGYAIREHDSKSICQGPGYDLVVETTKAPGGITGFVATLRHDVPRRTERIGKLTVEFENRTATFHLQ